MSHKLHPSGSVAACADAMRPFVCSRTDSGLHAEWVNVAGELDVATVPQLVQTLREVQIEARLIVLDLRELTFIDASGVQAIVSASIRAREAGCRLILLRGSANVDRVFSLSGYASEVEIGDLDPAVPPYSPHQRSLVSSSLLRTREARRAS